jgi:hypothetical protein
MRASMRSTARPGHSKSILRRPPPARGRRARAARMLPVAGTPRLATDQATTTSGPPVRPRVSLTDSVSSFCRFVRKGLRLAREVQSVNDVPSEAYAPSVSWERTESPSRVRAEARLRMSARQRVLPAVRVLRKDSRFRRAACFPPEPRHPTPLPAEEPSGDPRCVSRRAICMCDSPALISRAAVQCEIPH